jgi:hypothetical protein
MRRLKKDMSCDNSEIMKNAFAYVESLDDKLKSQVKNTKEIQDMFDFDNDAALSFFNKRQTKHKDTDGFDTDDKVGQGVAAYAKRINIVLGAYARTMLDKIKRILEREKRNIHLATHLSEAQMNDLLVPLMQNRNRNSKYTCNDFKEWDASFRTVFARITHMLLGMMGLPSIVNDWFLDNRKKWKMFYMGPEGTSILSGFEKQFSGNPFTIAENTICNMALCYALFEYRDVDFGLFKGDDSGVSCVDCKLLPSAAKILAYTQHGLKLHNSPIGEFAGWFLTSAGLFPDVFRYTVKFICKNYRDEDHFNEALTSLQERCSAVKNVHQLTEGCEVVSAYYSDKTGRPVSSETVRQWFYFLQNSRQVKFRDLDTYTKHINIV